MPRQKKKKTLNTNAFGVFINGSGIYFGSVSTKTSGTIQNKTCFKISFDPNHIFTNSTLRLFAFP